MILSLSRRWCRRLALFAAGLFCHALLSLPLQLLWLTPAQAVDSGPAACAAIINPLTPEEMKYAQSAWNYFVDNTQPDTGFTNSAGGYPSGTLWDMGNYLMALNAARFMGLIEQAEFDGRLNNFLAGLGSLELFEGKLPNKVYQSATGEMVDYGNNSLPRGIGWSALDIGRMLAAFHVLEICHPQYGEWMKGIVDSWQVDLSVKDEMMYGATVLPDDSTLLVQEGRLGYEEYAARGYELWGYKVPKAISYEPYEFVDIYGVDIPIDKRDFQTTNANNYVVSESYILDAIEFGLQGDQADYARRVYEVQKRRFEDTGILTAVTEDNINGPPYFLYSTVYSNGVPWAVITETNELHPELRTVSSKAAFGWHYVYPEEEYAAKVFDKVKDIANSERGYYAGVFEQGLYEPEPPINDILTGNTNGLIMEILYYKARGNQPLVGGGGGAAPVAVPAAADQQADPAPAPEPAPEPAPTPQPAPTPEPAPTPAPEPAPTEIQFPDLTPAEASTPAPTPAPTPSPAPAPAPPAAAVPDNRRPVEVAVEPAPAIAAAPPPPSSRPDPLRVPEAVAVAPIPPVSRRIGASTCPVPQRALTVTDRRYAETAWQYFEANVAASGLVRDRADLDGATLWGLGDYLGALHAAYSLEIIDGKTFDKKVRHLLGALGQMDLFSGELPHRAYNTRSLSPVDYGGNEDPVGNGWSGLDVGRMLSALHSLKTCHPQYTDVVDQTLLDWSYLRVVRNGRIANARLGEDSKGRSQVKVKPAQILGYEEYAARGFQLWGFDVNESAVGGNYQTAKVDEEAVPVERSTRVRREEHERLSTISTPFILYGLEFGFDPQMKRLVDSIFHAEANRYARTGIFSASGTTLGPRSPRVVHSTVVAEGEPWVATDSGGEPIRNGRVVSTAVAFAYHTLYPDHPYSQELWRATLDLYNHNLGYYEGFKESNGKRVVGFTGGTNSLILQALLHKATERQPIVQIHRDFDSPWWHQVRRGNSGQGLPESGQVSIEMRSPKPKDYWGT